LYIWAYLIFAPKLLTAIDFSETSFLIAKVNAQNYSGDQIWDRIESNNGTGIELDLELDTLSNQIELSNTGEEFNSTLDKIFELIQADNSRLIPVFINYDGNIHLLDSIINASKISSRIFYLPQGETWPTMEYLVQANRRIIFFVQGDFTNESRILHPVKNYALQISANTLTANTTIPDGSTNINLELLIVNNFDKLPTSVPPNRQSRNLVPDYINFLLSEWKKYGKKPNFIFIGRNINTFDFIIDQLNSFSAIKGKIRTSGGKNLEKVYWKNPDVLVTGGKFSFPYRGGEEIILSPFAPGYSMIPEQIIVTGEMVFPENYSINANPVKLSEGLNAGFNFEGVVFDIANPTRVFNGENFSFSQDIDRGQVLRLPENAFVNLGEPGLYGLPNSSFRVCCFVKFTDILEFGDNAILGNYEQGYRRGMHLILRSGHPYFGLWANDFMSDETLKNNTWYHLAWRYIIETGEQGIFVNGEYIGGSDGHPPYSGTSNLHIGSAFSQGASLRGYIDNLYIYNRPLGNEEIYRLYLDEEIILEEETSSKDLFKNRQLKFFLPLIALLVLLVVFIILYRNFRVKKRTVDSEITYGRGKNQILLFGEFTAFDAEQENVSDLFTPKVKELFLFVLLQTLKNGIGAEIHEINENLWQGTESKKVANNRSVTLNKLRKILLRFDKVEIVSNNGYLQLKTSKSFFCDYIEAFRLCQIPEGMSKIQLERFFILVKGGRFLKGIDWPWLDDTRGFIGSQVIDNLLKLASVYKKETKLKEVEKVVQRILEYDDLNEEAIFLQIWALQKANNTHLAKFSFNSFCTKYEKNMGESYSMDFYEFSKYYSAQL